MTMDHDPGGPREAEDLLAALVAAAGADLAGIFSATTERRCVTAARDPGGTIDATWHNLDGGCYERVRATVRAAPEGPMISLEFAVSMQPDCPIPARMFEWFGSADQWPEFFDEFAGQWAYDSWFRLGGGSERTGAVIARVRDFLVSRLGAYLRSRAAAIATGEFLDRIAECAPAQLLTARYLAMEHEFLANLERVVAEVRAQPRIDRGAVSRLAAVVTSMREQEMS